MSTFETDRFLRDVATHEMQVIRDDGLYRHLRFRRPQTMCMHFDLITWPGHLAYVGDMGSFTFTRLTDMFEFFRCEPGNLFQIDRRYWAEKCIAADKNGGLEEYRQDMFETAIEEWFKSYLDGRDDVDKDALWGAIDDEVLAKSYDSEIEAHRAAHDFEWDGHSIFQDFYEVRARGFTDRFTWCCHALAWGIEQYDRAKAAVPA